MSKKRVTAVIPCHNHEKWVVDAINSVATQSYLNKQIVVVNDGSTDNSLKNILKKLKVSKQGTLKIPENPEIFYGHFNNIATTVISYKTGHGPSFARNRGMEIYGADTDIFAFLDSDDIYKQGKLEKSVPYFMNPMTGVVYTDYDTFNDTFRMRNYKEPFNKRRLVEECIVNCNSLVSKKAIEICDGFDEEMRVCEDYDLWMRISDKFLVFHIPESLVDIRVGQHSSTNQINKEVWRKNWQRVMAKAQDRAKHG